jgi:hypothetical protein
LPTTESSLLSLVWSRQKVIIAHSWQHSCGFRHYFLFRIPFLKVILCVAMRHSGLDIQERQISQQLVTVAKGASNFCRVTARLCKLLPVRSTFKRLQIFHPITTIEEHKESAPLFFFLYWEAFTNNNLTYSKKILSTDVEL